MKFLRSRKKPPTLLGIHINVRAITLVELAYIHSNYVLQHYAKISLQIVTHATAPSLLDPSAASVALAQTLHAFHITTTEVALGLENSQVICKTILLDATLNTNEINTHVQERAAQYCHQPIQELMVDFEILGPAKNQRGLVEVRWVAAHQREVATKLTILAAAGLNATIVDLNSFALQRATTLLASALSSDGLGLLHIENDALFISVIPYPMGEHNPIEPIITPLTLDTSAVTPVQAICHSLQLSLNTQPFLQTIKLLLLAGDYVTTELQHTIEKLTGIPTQVIDPFNYLNKAVTSNTGSTTYPPHEFLLGVGLAMRVQK